MSRLQSAARPLVVTEGLRAQIEMEFKRMVWALAPNSGTPGIDSGERWSEALRRCNRWPLSLRDACWTVVTEMREGNPSCWV